MDQSGAEEEEAHSSERYWKAEEPELWVGASSTWTIPGEVAGWFYSPLWTSQANNKSLKHLLYHILLTSSGHSLSCPRSSKP